jgi:hypothetical protein
VARFEQVRQFVQQHVVDHPSRHRPQSIGQPDRPVGHRAGAPTTAHVANPAHAQRFCPAVQVVRGQFGRSTQQGRVTGPDPGPFGLSPGHQFDHLGHQPPLVRAGDPSRHQHHDLVAVPIGRHGAAPARTAPDLNLLSRIDHAPTLGLGDDITCSPIRGCGPSCRVVDSDPAGAASTIPGLADDGGAAGPVRPGRLVHRLSTAVAARRPEVIHNGLHKCGHAVEGYLTRLWTT